jgi:signal transduction histidine kinase
VAQQRALASREEQTKRMRQLTQIIVRFLLEPLEEIMQLAKRYAKNPQEVRGSRESWRIVLDSGKRQQRMIEAILELATIFYGKTRPKISRIELCSIVNKMPDFFANELRDKTLTLNVKIPDAPLYVWANRQSLEAYIVGAMVANAIKNSPPSNEISVELAEFQDGPKKFVGLTVSDKGPVPSAEELAQLFEPVTSSHSEKASFEIILKLHLMIAKGHIGHFGGQVLVSENEGEGRSLLGTRVVAHFRSAARESEPLELGEPKRAA